MRWRDEHGVVGGIEVLPFGLLIFVAGTLIIVNAWAVVDAKLGVEAAAREAGRAYVESPELSTAEQASLEAARSAMAGAGRDPDRMILTRHGQGYLRCAPVEHVVRYHVPAITVPFVGGIGRGTTVTGRHREIIDPYRAGLGSAGACGP